MRIESTDEPRESLQRQRTAVLDQMEQARKDGDLDKYVELQNQAMTILERISEQLLQERSQSRR